MKRILIIISTALLLSSCGVKKADYEAAIAEASQYSEELAQAKADNESLSAQVSSAYAENSSISKELSDANQNQESLSKEYASYKATMESYKESMAEYEGLAEAEAERRRIEAESIATAESIAALEMKAKLGTYYLSKILDFSVEQYAAMEGISISEAKHAVYIDLNDNGEGFMHINDGGGAFKWTLDGSKITIIPNASKVPEDGTLEGNTLTLNVGGEQIVLVKED